jgi:hypothetical protein
MDRLMKEARLARAPCERIMRKQMLNSREFPGFSSTTFGEGGAVVSCIGSGRWRLAIARRLH